MTFLRMAFFPLATSGDFDALAGLMPAEAPAGRLLFAAGPSRGGWQVVQLWESKVLLDAFNHAVLVPALNRLGGSSRVWVPAEIVDLEPAQLSIAARQQP